MLRIPKYSFVRRDANATGRKGVSVYVLDTIRDFTSMRFDFESVPVESIWLQVKTGRRVPVAESCENRRAFSSFGLKPNAFYMHRFQIKAHTSKVWFDEFVTRRNRVQDHKHTTDILLLGDFNTDMFKSNPAWASTRSLFNLDQYVQSATRVTLTTSTLVDHI